MTSETKKMLYRAAGLVGIFAVAIVVVWALGMFGIESPPTQ